MKVIPAIVAALVAAGMSPVFVNATAGAAQQDDNGKHRGRDAVRACREFLLPFVPEANLGECVSYVQNFGTQGFPAHFCDAERETNPDFDLIFDSYSECVRLIRAQIQASEFED